MYYISLTNFLTSLNNFYIISSYLGFPKSLPCTLISADELIPNSIRKNTDIEAIRKDIPHIPYTRSDKPATSMFPYVTKQIPPQACISSQHLHFWQQLDSELQ